jgi:hypothetical protein
VAGSRKLSSEHDQLRIRCDNLQDELAQACSDAEKCISDLEAKVASTEARSAKIGAKGETDLKDFQVMLVQQLEQVHDMYVEKIQSIGCLCSAMSAEEPSFDDYLNWLSEEVTGLPDVFGGVNENFAIAAIEGPLALADDSVNLEAVRSAASEASVELLPAASGV